MTHDRDEHDEPSALAEVLEPDSTDHGFAEATEAWNEACANSAMLASVRHDGAAEKIFNIGFFSGVVWAQRRLASLEVEMDDAGFG